MRRMVLNETILFCYNDCFGALILWIMDVSERCLCGLFLTVASAELQNHIK